MIGNGAAGQNGSLRTGSLENQMEEGGRIAWRWRRLVWGCGMILIAVGLPAGVMKWGTRHAIIDLLQNQRGEFVIFFICFRIIVMFRYCCGYSLKQQQFPGPEQHDCGIWTIKYVKNLEGTVLHIEMCMEKKPF